MKRFIMILIVALTLCGVGYLGYLIFESKSIQSVEIEGQIQTLYVAGDDIDFQDAKLKVTYKNGNIKTFDIDSNKVDVSMFSADVARNDATMIISYKSFKFEVNYDVIEKGAWYLSKNQVTNVGGSTTETSYIDGTEGGTQTTKFIYIHSDGVLEYYKRTENGWFMYDGRVDTSYNYSISGDTMTINLDDDVYELKSDYQEKGYMNLVSTKITKDSNGLDLKKEVLEFKPSQKFKEKKYRPVVEVKLDDDISYKFATTTTETLSGKSYKVVNFKRGETLETASKRSYNSSELFIKVTYNDDFMNVVYVNICDEMIGKFPLITKSATDEYVGDYFSFSYEGKNPLVIHYMVIS